MKALAFTLLALLLGACTTSNDAIVQATPSTTRTKNRVYTISCEIGGEWVDYQTKRHPYQSYGARSGIWSFLTVEGQSVFATNCSAIFKAE